MQTSTSAEDPASLALRLERLQGHLVGDPDNVVMRADIFDLALSLSSLTVAQAQTTWALQRMPDDRAWRNRLALLAMTRGHWPEAAQLLQGLIDENEEDLTLACNLAYVRGGTGWPCWP